MEESRANGWRAVKELKKRVSHYCPIVSNKDLRNELITRSIDLGVSMKEVCIKADVSWDLFERKYLNVDVPKSDWYLRADEITAVAAVLGYKVKITIIKQSIEKVSVAEILKGIPKNERKKNKKLD